MTSNTVPIYRHGRKFYVSAQEYARIRSEERRHRRTAVQKSQHLPVPKSHQTSLRPPPASLHNSVQRSNSNPYEPIHGILKTPRLPANSLINAVNRFEPNRLSRSMLRSSDEQTSLLSNILPPSKKLPSTNIRSSSSDKILDIRRTPLSLPDAVDDTKYSLANETALSSPQQSPIPLRRSLAPIVSDYGISSTTAFSLTPTDQTHTQTNTSKLSNYLTRIKQSSLNPSSPSTAGGGSYFETGMQGSDYTYSVLGSTNQRHAGGSSSLLTRSISDNSKNKYYERNSTHDSPPDDDHPRFESTLIQRRKTDFNPYRQSRSTAETDDDSGQQRDLRTRSTHRSQSSDGLTEKKRVRFADMEGLTLESKSNQNNISSPIDSPLINQRQLIKLPSDLRGRPQPFLNALYQATTKTDGTKLATNV